MANWQDLPTELILYILQNLHRTRDHKCASSVSRKLHVLVEPQLYASVSIPQITHYPPYENDLEDRTRLNIFRHFVRTIVGRPTLGVLVKRLKLEVWEEMDYHHKYSEDIQRYHLNLSEEDSRKALADINSDEEREDLALIATAAVAKGLPNGMVLGTGSRGLAILLFHYLPNLKDLSILSYDDIEPVALACLDFFIGGVPAGLLSINTLVLDYGYNEKEARPCISMRRISLRLTVRH